MARCSEFIPRWARGGAKSAADAIDTFNKILIAAHVRPDGDAIGSMYACGWIASALGREVAIYIPDGVPDHLDFLLPPVQIHRDLSTLPFVPRSAIYVDCSEAHRLGPALAEAYQNWPSVNIDHHLCDKGLGSAANFIEPRAAATCQLVAYVGNYLGIDPKDDLGKALAAGILTDTGNFTHNNTSAEVFCLCAELENNGVHTAAVGANLRSRWSLSRLRLWGALFEHIGQARGSRIAWSVISETDLERHGCSADELDGYIDCLGRLQCVLVAFTLRGARERDKEGMVRDVSRLSVRSKDAISARDIAMKFGGGGHKNAAGATIWEPADKALPLVLQEIEKYFDANHL